MKKNTLIVIIFFLVFSTIHCHSQSENKTATETGIIFFNGTLKEALQKSADTNKPIMIDVSTSWCSYCKKLKKYTFTDKKAADFFNTNFINIEIDAEKGEGISIAQKYQVSSYPTLIFIDKNKKLILFSEGFLMPDGLIETGKMALKNMKL